MLITGRAVGFAADREVTHLALDPAGVATVPAGDDTLVEEFGEHRLMKCLSPPRGEGRQRQQVYGARRGRRVETRADRDLCRPATRPRASGRGPRNAPGSARRTPDARGPGFCCAARYGRRADGSSVR